MKEIWYISMKNGRMKRAKFGTEVKKGKFHLLRRILLRFVFQCLKGLHEKKKLEEIPSL